MTGLGIFFSTNCTSVQQRTQREEAQPNGLERAPGTPMLRSARGLDFGNLPHHFTHFHTRRDLHGSRALNTRCLRRDQSVTRTSILQSELRS